MDIIQETETQIILKANLIKRYFYLHEYLFTFMLAFAFLGAYALIVSADVQYPFDSFLIIGGIVIVILVIRYRNLTIIATEYDFDQAREVLVITTRMANWSTYNELAFEHIKSIALFRKNNRRILGLKCKSKEIWLSKSTYETAEKLSGFLRLPLYLELDEDQIIQLPTTSNLQEPHTFALSCSKCGGQLPLMASNDYQIKCEFCGTVSRIEWK